MRRTSPPAVTISSAETAVERLPFFDAGAMRAGGAGTGDRDMRQRGQIVERESLLIEIRAQLPVAHSRLDRDPPRRAIELHDLLHLAKREEIVGAVGNPVEAVAGAENLEPLVFSDELLDLRQRGRRSNAFVLYR